MLKSCRKFARRKIRNRHLMEDIVSPISTLRTLTGSSFKFCFISVLYVGPHRPSGKDPDLGLGGRRTPGSKADSTKNPPCICVWWTLNPSRPPAAVVRKFREGVPAQVLSSSSYHGSNLLGPSQSSHHAAS
ncbi:hypothetical protein AVEN_123418-1 [Araneus ventricosus]|uniref:Uncharacterized protein n=1 Tax=Araneus ventricosus TaxID=182803 RepID=A0A4Y2T833_ARAVE|nr:hypothetical protein AVEN_123418-1 [Araneus ventricosus]